jgi:prepilin-type N-terminal cleavage/methylation domain-containing protein
MPFRRFPSRPGYTLVELAVAMVLLVAIAMITTTSLATQLRRARVNQAATVVGGDLQLALSTAARQRRPVRIAYSAPATKFTTTDRATGTVLRSRTLKSGAEWNLETISFSPTTIDVYPGGSTSAPLPVVLSSGGYSRTITMTRAGLVRSGP